MRRRPPLVAAFDLQSVLLATFLALVLLMVPPQRRGQIETFGEYAITMSWKDGSRSDLDLYVQDPGGAIVSFDNRDAGRVHLEHDDQGTPDALNFERIVLRGTEPGEYVVNVHAYRKRGQGIDHVRVELWRLLGRDTRLHVQELKLGYDGEERTAFRFTRDGKYSRLPRSMFS